MHALPPEATARRRRRSTGESPRSCEGPLEHSRNLKTNHLSCFPARDSGTLHRLRVLLLASRATAVAARWDCHSNNAYPFGIPTVSFDCRLCTAAACQGAS